MEHNLDFDRWAPWHSAIIITYYYGFVLFWPSRVRSSPFTGMQVVVWCLDHHYSKMRLCRSSKPTHIDLESRTIYHCRTRGLSRAPTSFIVYLWLCARCVPHLRSSFYYLLTDSRWIASTRNVSAISIPLYCIYFINRRRAVNMIFQIKLHDSYFVTAVFLWSTPWLRLLVAVHIGIPTSLVCSYKNALVCYNYLLGFAYFSPLGPGAARRSVPMMVTLETCFLFLKRLLSVPGCVLGIGYNTCITSAMAGFSLAASVHSSCWLYFCFYFISLFFHYYMIIFVCAWEMPPGPKPESNQLITREHIVFVWCFIPPLR